MVVVLCQFDSLKLLVDSASVRYKMVFCASLMYSSPKYLVSATVHSEAVFLLLLNPCV